MPLNSGVMCAGQALSEEYDLGMDTTLKNLPVED